ncbi:hypothetical protein GQ55_8G187700 [Panicum hallii var. hallii]|uniref:Uncharacterized protein n=1 Tax=Panicum hallii var. hallii TaxID=1504633 RepID=A0A2T7CNW0_9POAL|nr:hypothetical protein GQ55_8G187700 [Panicum hallii var. hallii]
MPSSLSTTTRLPLQSTTTLGKPLMRQQQQTRIASSAVLPDASWVMRGARWPGFSPSPSVFCFFASFYFFLLHGC